jgi:hypothetical protein
MTLYSNTGTVYEYECLDVFRGVDNPPVASLVVQLVAGLSIDLSPTLVVVWVRVNVECFFRLMKWKG